MATQDGKIQGEKERRKYQIDKLFPWDATFVPLGQRSVRRRKERKENKDVIVYVVANDTFAFI